MIDLKRIRVVALDIAGAGQSYDRQDELSEFIWHLLSRHYRMFVFTSNRDESLATEDFNHPGLVFLREEMPPSQELLESHPELLGAETLWITDDPQMQQWIRAGGLPFMHQEYHGKAITGGQHLPHLSELGALLNPTGLLLQEFTGTVNDLRRFRPKGALLVGIGGPPHSGFQQFALDLRTQLQDGGHELVDLLDLSTLIRPTEALLETEALDSGVWVSREVEGWLLNEVLEPLRAGEAVYVEAPPSALPRDFSAHFPLYVSEESVLLLFAELVFSPGIMERLDLSILLEVSTEETTRRLYEIPRGERFDPKFSDQYMTREGAVYKEYLERNRVRERVSLLVDANREGAFFLASEARGRLV